MGGEWKYLKGRSDPPTDWTSRTFDDSAWLKGRTGFGYGDGDDTTILTDMQNGYATLYARRAFPIVNPGSVRKFIFRISYDDGFVAYVNGTEVARKGLGNPGSPVNHSTLASSHEAGIMEAIDLPAAIPLLVSGENLLAIEIHNSALNGDDLSFVPALTVYGPDPALRRGPYLQLMTESSALIVWETDPPTAGAVEYGETADLGLRADLPQVLALHEARIEGLRAGTEHFYRVLAGEKALTPIYSFRTAPAPLSGAFRVAVLGDTEKMNEGFLDTAPLVESFSSDLALILGDVIRGGDADAYVFDHWSRVMPRCPFFATLGNHDLDDDAGAAYFQAFYLPSQESKSERYYSFDYGNVHFVSLDVMGTFAAGSTQYKWLRSDLAANDLVWTIVFFHKSPYSTGTVHGSDSAVRGTLVPVFDEFKVDLVFSGHNHNYERSYPIRGGAVVDPSKVPTYVDPQGTIYIVSGGAGGSLYAQDAGADKKYSALFKLTNHACKIDIDGRLLVLQAVDINGAVIDRLEIRKSEPTPPTIGGLEVSEVRGTSARISWTTDRPCDSTVEYGKDGSFGLQVSDGRLVTAHSLDLQGLDPETSYEARVRSRDSSGNEAASDAVPFETIRLFIRGDSNGDGDLNLSDAIGVLFVLFSGESPSNCPDASDADDSGSLDLTDAISILGFLFLNSPPLPAPFPSAGDDPTEDLLQDCRAA